MKKTKMKKTILNLLMTSLAVLSADAFALDCTKAKLAIELKLCASSELKSLDSLLNEVYQKRIDALDKVSSIKLKKDQKAWMIERNRCMVFSTAQMSSFSVEEGLCLRTSYEKRIEKLGEVERLTTLYREECKRDERKCLPIASLDERRGKWADVINDLTTLCDANHDGDGGSSCFRKARALERLGKKSEALAVVNQVCSSRKNNEACAMANRLGKKQNRHRWAGLYRNSTGTLFIKELDSSILLLRAYTIWENGHLCVWELKGKVSKNKLLVEKDPEDPTCSPVVMRQGKKIVVKDPGWKCKDSHCGALGIYEGTFEFDFRSNP